MARSRWRRLPTAAGVYEAWKRQWPHLLGHLVFISGYAEALDERLRTFITQNSVPISKPFKRSQISKAIKGKELSTGKLARRRSDSLEQ